MLNSQMPMISSERLSSMQKWWVKTLEQYRVTSTNAKPVFDILVDAYTASNRYYHNLDHLAEMFNVAERLSATVEQPVALQLAIWFHDAIYDSRAKDNEIRSGELAGALLGPLGLPASAIESVVQMILATSHTASVPVSIDTQVLLDADLAILGESEERYARYANDIRKEYQWVPDEEYRVGRANVLKKFLATPRIYHTRIMYEEGETRARSNLKAELALLSAQKPDFPS